MSRTVRVLFWNLFEAGVDQVLRLDDSRWRLQVELVRELAPDVLLTTEGWAWQYAGEELFTRAKLGFDMDGVLFPAKTGCDQAVFWRPGIRAEGVDRLPHEQAQWHGRGRVDLRLPGWPEPVAFVVAHLDPFSPTNRLIESDHLRNWLPTDRPVVLGMDANSLAPGDPEPEWNDVPARKLHNHLLPGTSTADRRPVTALLGDPERPLLVDAGAHLGDRRPTFGQHPPYEAERRIDLLLISPALVGRLVSYTPVEDKSLYPVADRLGASDHRPVLIELETPS
ncbi:endonuclease/exonuclease/phosphatase family metal-dependent hydrolase [Crossiella equi]|uniref:Endonuclease/exonuclease/phosphatase family metal-dependent hydrolase n=1 Tax=Crossiella equi TaxID=130796 RepID=A0ABS5APZ1_9PSEU|nr:endonuclease/exonuclease/phosphatase family protein [Crossiella equi]MBP2478624.1 endonuclease/exonuclease/phosphatase family metal-dependent hydrolase [Crossiella equi]